MEISQENRLWYLPEGVRESCLSGVFTYITSPGAFEQLDCPVCRNLCQVERNAPFHPGHIAAMAGIARPHDRFFCPFDRNDWHYTAYKLIHAIDEMPSMRVADLMRQDLKELLEKHLSLEK